MPELLSREAGASFTDAGCLFRMMLIGFFEGIESERGTAWRVADWLCLRETLRIGMMSGHRIA